MWLEMVPPGAAAYGSFAPYGSLPPGGGWANVLCLFLKGKAPDFSRLSDHFFQMRSFCHESSRIPICFLLLKTPRSEANPLTEGTDASRFAGC